MTASLARVAEILAAGTWSGDPVDRIVLDFEDRFRRRIVLRGQNGTRFLLELADPRLLRDGDGLRLDDGTVVAVQAAAESLAEITCKDSTELVRMAWHLGNRHVATQIQGDRLLIREDHVIIGMVVELGGRVRPVKAPFEPEGGAYGHGRARGRDHAHGHGDG